MTQTRIRIIDASTPGVPRDHDRFNVNRGTKAGASVQPAPRGLALTPQNGLRDPFVLDTGGRRWLFYAAAGEYALGVTDISGA